MVVEFLPGFGLFCGSACAPPRNLRAAAPGLINKEVRSLEGHLEDMHYAALREQKLPIGPWIVESAVRRVLRFKSVSTCWRTDHLKPLLYLRAIAQAGRWDDFMTAWLDHTHWLQPQHPARQPHSRLAACPVDRPPFWERARRTASIG